MDNSQNIEESQGNLEIDKILSEVCQELWLNNNTSNINIEKDAFYWTKEATQAFEKLKVTILRAHVLATLDFIIFLLWSVMPWGMALM